jgi:hypothetical protein
VSLFLLRSALFSIAVALVTAGTSLTAANRPPVKAAELSYSVDSSAGPDVYGNGAYTGPVAKSDGNWAFRIEGEPRTLIRFNDRATTNQDFQEDGTYFTAQLVYHFRLNAVSAEAFDAALRIGSLTFVGFTDFFETAGIQTLSGQANVALLSQLGQMAAPATAFEHQVSCSRFSLSGCGRQDFSTALNLADFADRDTLSFNGSVRMSGDYYAPRVGAANAFRSMRIDPVLGLSGAGLSQSNYALELSPGIGNGVIAAVPEPSTWALMIAGFGLVGGTLRRKKSAELAAA